MRICLILEGCYPYINGGVSTWMHQYINEMPEHEFVLWVIGAKAEDKDKFVYTLPDNVVEVQQVFLDDALRVKDSGVLDIILMKKIKKLIEDLCFPTSRTGICCLSYIRYRRSIRCLT